MLFILLRHLPPTTYNGHAHASSSDAHTALKLLLIAVKNMLIGSIGRLFELWTGDNPSRCTLCLSLSLFRCLALCLWLRTMTTTTTNLGQREWERKRRMEWGREGEWGQTSSSRSPSLLWAFDFKCQRCLGKLVNELTTTTNWNKIDKTRTTTPTSSGCSSAAQLSASFDSLRQPVVALPLSLSLSLLLLYCARSVAVVNLCRKAEKKSCQDSPSGNVALHLVELTG